MAKPRKVGWLLELLEEGHSDRGVKAELPPVDRMSMPDFQDLADQHPGQAAKFRDSVEIRAELGDLIADQIQKGPDGNPTAIFVALESVLLSIVKDLGSPKGLGNLWSFHEHVPVRGFSGHWSPEPCIEDRDPEQQAKLRQVGLRSSFENWLFQSHEHPILF
jgi:hypothetical protein